MIELRNLTKSYPGEGGRRYVFRDLSFSFPDGVNIGLIGRNGAGKSTLMRLLGGIDTPDRGQVVTNKSISWPVGLQGGFQGTMTGRDNVKFVCRIFGASDAEIKDRVRFVEEFAEIGDYFDQPVKSYSSGMRSRLGFGLSMAFEFDYYLIDEVMAVGDAQFKRKSKSVLEERLKSSNLILVTHNMGEVAKFCEVVVLLKDGGATLYDDVRAGIRAYQDVGGTAAVALPQEAVQAGSKQVPSDQVERQKPHPQAPSAKAPDRKAEPSPEKRALGSPKPGNRPQHPPSAAKPAASNERQADSAGTDKGPDAVRAISQQADAGTPGGSKTPDQGPHAAKAQPKDAKHAKHEGGKNAAERARALAGPAQTVSSSGIRGNGSHHADAADPARAVNKPMSAAAVDENLRGL